MYDGGNYLIDMNIVPEKTLLSKISVVFLDLNADQTIPVDMPGVDESYP